MRVNDEIKGEMRMVNARRLQSRRKLVRRRRLVLGIIAGLLVLAVVGVMVLVSRLEGNLTVARLQSDAAAMIDGAEVGSSASNVLVLGSDGRDTEGNYGEDTGTRRSDSMMLVHISDGNTRIEAVQIPRDTMLLRPACDDVGFGAFAGGRGMINSAFNHGENCSVRAVETLTGLRIDHVMSLNFDGFARVVDAVGGIKVCLEHPLQDKHALLDLPAGEQELGGEDALALARVRYAIGDGSDISRMANQQMVMSAIAQRATSAEVLSRPDRLYAFVDAITSSLTVDEGLSSISQLAGLALRVNEVPDKNITFLTMPWQPAASNAARVEPSADAQRLWDALAADRPLQFSSDEDAKYVPKKGEDTSREKEYEGADETQAASEEIDTVKRTAAAPVC